MTPRRTSRLSRWTHNRIRGVDAARLAIVIATAVSLMAYFAVSKLIAIRHGVQGMAALGVLLAISNLFVLFGDLNVGPEFMRRLAVRGNHEHQDREYRELVGTVFAITLIVSAVLVMILVSASPLVASGLNVTKWSVVAAGLAGAITAIAQQCFNFLSGRGSISRMALVSSLRVLTVFLGVFSALVLLSLSIPSAYLVGQVAGGSLSVFLTLGKFRRLALSKNIAYLKTLLKAGLSMTATLMTYGGVLFALPLIIQSTAGTEVNGLMKAGLLLSGGLLQFFNSMLRYEFLPRLSASHSHLEVKASISAEVKLLIPAFGFAALTLVILRPIVWPILFTSEFASAAMPLIWIVIGDIQRLFVAIVGYSLFSLSGVKPYLLLESIGGVSLFLAVWLASEASAKVLPIAIGYSIAHMVALFGAVLLARRQIRLDNIVGLCLPVGKVVFLILFSAASISAAGLIGYVPALMALTLLGRETIRGLRAKRETI